MLRRTAAVSSSWWSPSLSLWAPSWSWAAKSWSAAWWEWGARRCRGRAPGVVVVVGGGFGGRRAAEEPWFGGGTGVGVARRRHARRPAEAGHRLETLVGRCEGPRSDRREAVDLAVRRLRELRDLAASAAQADEVAPAARRCEEPGWGGREAAEVVDRSERQELVVGHRLRDDRGIERSECRGASERSRDRADVVQVDADERRIRAGDLRGRRRPCRRRAAEADDG